MPAAASPESPPREKESFLQEVREGIHAVRLELEALERRLAAAARPSEPANPEHVERARLIEKLREHVGVVIEGRRGPVRITPGGLEEVSRRSLCPWSSIPTATCERIVRELEEDDDDGNER